MSSYFRMSLPLFVVLMLGLSACSGGKKATSGEESAKATTTAAKKPNKPTVSPSMATYDDPAKWHSAVFNTSAKCNECAGRLKQALLSQRGIKEVELDAATGVVNLMYHETLSSEQDILKIFFSSGFDVDGRAADEGAKSKLPECCR